jgi:hypothetical protein
MATGSLVLDAKMNGVLGIPFIAFAPYVGVAIGVYLFGKISPHQRNLIHHLDDSLPLVTHREHF